LRRVSRRGMLRLDRAAERNRARKNGTTQSVATSTRIHLRASNSTMPSHKILDGLESAGDRPNQTCGSDTPHPAAHHGPHFQANSQNPIRLRSSSSERIGAQHPIRRRGAATVVAGDDSCHRKFAPESRTSRPTPSKAIGSPSRRSCVPLRDEQDLSVTESRKNRRNPEYRISCRKNQQLHPERIVGEEPITEPSTEPKTRIAGRKNSKSARRTSPLVPKPSVATPNRRGHQDRFR